jgi:hypothetical protein
MAPAGRATRQQHGHRLIAQPTQREREHPRRRAIKPLLIVNRHQQWAALHKAPEHAQHRARQRLGIALGVRVGDEQRRLDRVALGPGQRPEHLVRRVGEQVTQGREREPEIGL